MQFISTLKRTILLCLTYIFTILVIFLNGTNCIINNGNILTDGSKEKNADMEKKQNVIYKNEKIY